VARLSILLLPVLLWGGAACARDIVDASAPEELAVTVYRDPNRGTGSAMNRNWPRGFAMISETRQVTLPAGESTIRFTGVAEGMVAVSAIVTGLPGGTIEKNRNADLLSPAALVDGTLGNRVTITRTNPGTGEAASESAIIRTRADGGLVLQTDDGFEAVRCSGLPERLTFDSIPDGLSAQPVFTIDTRDESGGTYTITLTYLAWGFDWEANYVATLHEGGGGEDVRFDLVSWLTLLNDNDQSFADAELLVVAGTLNVTSDFRRLADPPTARPLQLTCYPLGSTADGSPIPVYDASDYAESLEERSIVVTGARQMAMLPAPPPPPPPPMVAQEENLGDLKLYRVPETVTVAAQSLKQIAFLRREAVAGRLLYKAGCAPGGEYPDPLATPMFLMTVNDDESGLGVALPNGRMAIFERGERGELLVGEDNLRDYASGQDVEISLGGSSQVFAQCQRLSSHDPGETGRWSDMQVTLTNANPAPVTMRLQLGAPTQWDVRGRRTSLKDGQRIIEVSVPANGSRNVTWQARPALSE